jgi:hypothetical protein
MDGNFARVGAGEFLMEIANGKKMSESTAARESETPTVCPSSGSHQNCDTNGMQMCRSFVYFVHTEFS